MSNRRRAQGRTPLHMAAEEGHEACVSALLADARVDPNQAHNGVSRPFAARCLLALPWLSYIIVEYNPSRHCTESSPTGLPPTHFPDCRHAQGWTPLHLAAEKGHEACVSALLANARVDPNQAANGVSRPSSAPCLPARPWLSYIIVIHDPSRHSTESSTTGLPPTHFPDCRHAQGWIPLYAAAYEGHEACVSALLTDARVDPNQATNNVSQPSSASYLQA